MASLRNFSRSSLATYFLCCCLGTGVVLAQDSDWETGNPSDSNWEIASDSSELPEFDEEQLIADWETADPSSLDYLDEEADDDWKDFEVSEANSEEEHQAVAGFPKPQLHWRKEDSSQQVAEPAQAPFHGSEPDEIQDEWFAREAPEEKAPKAPASTAVTAGAEKVKKQLNREKPKEEVAGFWDFRRDEPKKTPIHRANQWYGIEPEEKATVKKDAVPTAVEAQEAPKGKLVEEGSLPEKELKAQPVQVPTNLRYTQSETLKPLPTREEIIKRLEDRKAGEKPILDVDGNYRLRVGDTIRISIYGEINTDRILTIDAHGEVSYLLVGRIQAAGLTIDEFRKNINEEMAKNLQFALVNVVPVEFGGLSYTVLGQVRNPGKKSLLGTTRVLDAIASADGFAVGFFRSQTQDLADLNHAFLARRGEYVPVDFWRLVVLGDMTQNIEIEDGDYIFIPSSLIRNIYVLGEVRLPANIGYLNSETLAGAIAKARGVTRHADLYCYIVRGSLNNPSTMRVNLDDLQHGRIRDVLLQPGDIVYVPRRDTLLVEDVIFACLRSFVSGFFNVAGRETFIDLEPDAADSDFGGNIFFP